jgi:PPK2 family polyphosphate:nucleotide phosphotransferase
MSRASRLSKPFRVTDGRQFRLRDVPPDSTRGVKSKADAVRLLKRGIERLSLLQEKMYAENRWGLLLIFQAMDAAGKDGTIKHVMSGVNPQGCQVYSFKVPTSEELNHDFLWRTSRCLPERGRIGIFNRSYYEETLIVRVHPELLDNQKLPSTLVTKRIWQERFTDIVAFERYATRNGIAIRKFFLHVSREEQQRRFRRRLELPAKNWKFSTADAKEGEYWRKYMGAYEDMIRHTSSAHAPWYVVPADNKWFTRLIVSSAIIDAMEDLNLAFPKMDRAQRIELAAARAALDDPERSNGHRKRKDRRGDHL